jgi:phasin family protein
MENAATTPGDLYNRITNLVEGLALPGINLQSVVDSRRKDFEALVELNRKTIEGAQSVGQKQVEILRQTFEQLRDILKTAATSGVSPGAGDGAGELVQRSVNTALQNMRDLAAIAYKTQTDAFSVATKRVEESLEELKHLTKATP